MWIYNSQKQWQEQFNFSLYKIKKIIYSLEEKGLLLSKKVNAKKWNHTKWYSIDEEKYNSIIRGDKENQLEGLVKNRPIVSLKPTNHIKNKILTIQIK